MCKQTLYSWLRESECTVFGYHHIISYFTFNYVRSTQTTIVCLLFIFIILIDGLVMITVRNVLHIGISVQLTVVSIFLRALNLEHTSTHTLRRNSNDVIFFAFRCNRNCSFHYNGLFNPALFYVAFLRSKGKLMCFKSDTFTASSTNAKWSFRIITMFFSIPNGNWELWKSQRHGCQFASACDNIMILNR